MSENSIKVWISTTHPEDDWSEWITVHAHSYNDQSFYVSMERVYQTRDGAVRVDPEAGLTFQMSQLGEVIAALEKVRNVTPTRDPKGEGEG